VSADPRVTAAREYLRGARQRDINYLLPSRMMAELAETRRQPGQVLAAAPTAAGVVAGVVTAGMRWRERRRYGPRVLPAVIVLGSGHFGRVQGGQFGFCQRLR
jgi:hypothetical protein